jgi:hypothetical protein
MIEVQGIFGKKGSDEAGDVSFSSQKKMTNGLQFKF